MHFSAVFALAAPFIAVVAAAPGATPIGARPVIRGKPPAPDPNRHRIVLAPTSTSTVSPSATFVSSSTTVAVLTSTTVDHVDTTATRSSSTIASTVTSKSLISSASTPVPAPISKDQRAVFAEILQLASNASLDTNAFKFVNSTCNPEDAPQHPQFCEQTARALVQATQAYTEVFAFEEKINVEVRVAKDNNFQSTSLAEMSARALRCAGVSGEALTMSPMPLIRPSERNSSSAWAKQARANHSKGDADFRVIFNPPVLQTFLKDTWSSSMDVTSAIVGIVLHEIAHGLGMASFLELVFYDGQWYVVPDQQDGSFGKRVAHSLYDSRLTNWNNTIDIHKDISELGELIFGEASQVQTIKHIDTWPEAARHRSQELAAKYMSSICFPGKLDCYRLNTEENVRSDGLSHLESRTYIHSANFLMIPETSARVDVTLSGVYGKQNVPLKEAIGPAIRDILNTLGWKLRTQ